MSVLVLGFGPFGGFSVNPASRLAAALDGRRVGRGGHLVVGLEMPVSYDRSYTFTVEALRRHDPDFILGIGVAGGRTATMVERIGRNRAYRGAPDVDGVCLADHGTGTLQMICPVAEQLAEAIGLAVSDDAGEYVCNSWLFRVLRSQLPAALIHVVPEGYDADALGEGLGRFLDAYVGE